MPNYLRWKRAGGTFFFTVVTFRRQTILDLPESRPILRVAIKEVQAIHPFRIDAWVLLPEHLHCLWTLPEHDNDYSKRWGMIKAIYSRKSKALFYKEDWMTPSKRKYREGTVWQRRFWEHEIRDQTDYNQHMDYIHFNPVKHGHVQNVRDWPHSTFHRCVREGLYPQDWGDNSIDFADDVGME